MFPPLEKMRTKREWATIRLSSYQAGSNKSCIFLGGDCGSQETSYIELDSVGLRITHRKLDID